MAQAASGYPGLRLPPCSRAFTGSLWHEISLRMPGPLNALHGAQGALFKFEPERAAAASLRLGSESVRGAELALLPSPRARRPSPAWPHAGGGGVAHPPVPLSADSETASLHWQAAS